MKKLISVLIIIFSSMVNSQIIVNHNCWEISKIPDEYINNARNNIKFSYRHRSHGQQLVEYGTQQMAAIDASKYAFAQSWGLPTAANSLLVENRASYYPQDYWRGTLGKNNTISELDANTNLNVSGFMWCSDLNTLTESDVNEYLNTMAELEEMYSISGSKNRKVYFVYFTANMELDQWSPEYTYNKHLRNEQIRSWVKDHPEKNRILFDFADMDCWWFNPDTQAWEMNSATVKVDGVDHIIPVEHSRYVAANYSSDPGHTTTENIIHKGSALWWMLSRIMGWDGTALPVELTSFTASTTASVVELRWETATETNNYGYEILRSCDKIKWDKISFVPGNGNSAKKCTYSYTDLNAGLGEKVYYRLRQLDMDGAFEYSQIIEASFSYPSRFCLSQNYPNPFNPSTCIKFSIPQNSRVTLSLYNLLGEKIAVLLDAELNRGGHIYNFDASKYNLPSGIYFYTIQSAGYKKTMRMSLIK